MLRQLQFGVRALVGRRPRRLTMSRFLRCAPLTAAFVVSVGLFSWGWAEDDVPAEKAPAKESAAPPAEGTPLERALAAPVDWDFVETPLKDVASAIGAKTGINVWLDLKAITDAGGSADTPITFRIKRIPLRSALRLLLTEHELNFIADSDSENVLLITSDTKAKEHVVTQIYDARDLTRPVVKFTENEPKLDELIDLITSNIAPTSWSSAGGTGEIIPFGTQLIVTQTGEIYEQIGDLFAGLRQMRDAPQKIIDGGGQLAVRSSSNEVEIRKLLGRHHNLDFVETPLKDVLEVLNKFGISSQLDLKAIIDAGGSADTPITFMVKNLRLDSALRLMLQEHELDYIIDHDVLLITSDTKAKEHVVTDFYPVGDLIGDTSGKTKKEIDDAYENLTGAIKTTIAPTTWTDSGGTGSVTAFPPCKGIVCSQTEGIHDELAALLTKLRAGRTKDSASSQPSQPAVAVATKIYQLAPDHADAAADYVNVIRNLIEPKTWTGRDVYLGKVPGAIIARCSPATHERIELLLDELQALPRPPLGPTKSGGGAPVVGGLGGGGRGGAF
jgi:hypothetical protein